MFSCHLRLQSGDMLLFNAIQVFKDVLVMQICSQIMLDLLPACSSAPIRPKALESCPDPATAKYTSRSSWNGFHMWKGQEKMAICGRTSELGENLDSSWFTLISWRKALFTMGSLIASYPSWAHHWMTTVTSPQFADWKEASWNKPLRKTMEQTWTLSTLNMSTWLGCIFFLSSTFEP